MQKKIEGVQDSCVHVGGLIIIWCYIILHEQWAKFRVLGRDLRSGKNAEMRICGTRPSFSNYSVNNGDRMLMLA